jgi:hypothetical protein
MALACLGCDTESDPSLGHRHYEPQLFAYATGVDSISLEWTDASLGIVSYTIRMGRSPASLTTLATARADSRAFDATSLEPDTTYYFQIRNNHIDDYMESEPVSARTLAQTGSTGTFVYQDNLYSRSTSAAFFRDANAYPTSNCPTMETQIVGNLGDPSYQGNGLTSGVAIHIPSIAIGRVALSASACSFINGATPFRGFTTLTPGSSGWIEITNLSSTSVSGQYSFSTLDTESNQVFSATGSFLDVPRQ